MARFRDLTHCRSLGDSSSQRIAEANRRKDKAFTLMELIVMVVVLGILAVVAVPLVMKTLSSMRIRAAAQQVVSDIRAARSLASTSHDSIWVVFDVAVDEFSLYEGSSKSNRSLVRHPQTGGDWVVSFGVPRYRGVDISAASFGDSPELLFDPWGDAAEGGTVVLNNTVTIQVTELTGKTEIVD